MNLLVRIIGFILIIIFASPCLLSPLPHTEDTTSEVSADFEKFLTIRGKNNVDTNRRIYPSAFISDKRGSFNGNRARISLFHNPREGQAVEQFSQINLVDNKHDASNLGRLLWQQYNGHNFQQQSSQLTSNPTSSNPLSTSKMNILPNQETAQLDPVYVINAGTKDTARPQSTMDNVFIDLLHNQPSNTAGSELYATKFENLPKFSGLLFNSYLSGFANYIRGINSADKDCPTIIKTLPMLLISNFLDTITTIAKLQMANNLLIPFVILSVINFITSYQLLDQYCPDSR